MHREKIATNKNGHVQTLAKTRPKTVKNQN